METKVPFQGCLLFFTPAGLEAEALEVKDDGCPGYRFCVLFDFDTSPAAAEAALMKKVRKGLNQRHLGRLGGRYAIGAKRLLRGRIDWNEDFEDTKFDRVFCIDGKRITIEQFAKMLEEYEGWNFKFQIVDPSDQT